ncbi:MAG: TonB-dependent SusC/RagA subfamily outer membrane receptor [bacterium]|jgi:TonB-dependent SusC/RagA subfamily outer membrane receptor
MKLNFQTIRLWIVAFFLMVTIPFFAQNKKSQNISGKVTYLNVALPRVNIIINNNDQGTESDEKGEYQIKANTGDIIKYSYVGFETISILTEDITSVLNIEMIVKADDLDEIIIKSTKKNRDNNKSKKNFSTSKGLVNQEAAGYSVVYVGGNKIDLIYASLTEALDGRVAGVRLDPSTGKLAIRTKTSIYYDSPVLWEVDGVLFNDEPPINLNSVESIHILKSLAATNLYGSMGAGGVIVITTKTGAFINSNEQKKNIADQYTNKTIYNNDALIISEKEMWNSVEVDILKGFSDKLKALDYYENKVKSQIESYSESIKVARLFNNYYNDRNVSINILNELLIKHQNNPEIVKAIAYQIDHFNAKLEAEDIYEKIFTLRPTYAQSYRDLANAYIKNNKFKRAWRMYMSYLLQQKGDSEQKINDLLFNEMQWLYYNRKNQAGIKESFIPNNTINEFRKDIRLVFEWNTSEAEFNLEFVNPDKQSYVFEHNLVSNKKLIESEKKIGYSSKEFFIDDLGTGEWLINITYLGNKKPESTFFKVTIYNNWGSPNQSENIHVYNFEKERNKFQIFKLTNQ